jgi:D-alanine-D-alanine ligase
MDKAETKLRALRLGLPLPDAWHCRSLEQVEAALPEAVGADPEGRLVVKPNHGGSSTGMAITADREQAVDVARRTLEDGDTVLVESYIPGREITVALLDGEPYPVLEIAPHSGFYDYTNKYTKGRTEYLCPAPLDEGVAKLVREMAKTIHDDIGCRHLARVDFRLAGETDAMLLEVNTMPGMTALSLVPMAAASRGTDFPGLMDLFVRWTLRDAQPGRGVRED